MRKESDSRLNEALRVCDCEALLLQIWGCIGSTCCCGLDGALPAGEFARQMEVIGKKKKKGKAVRKLMPAMNSYPHPYCHSSKMRKSINVTEKGSCQKGEGGGEAIPIALVG